MLDIKFVRENMEAVTQAMKNRNAKWDADKFLQLDAQRREAIQEQENIVFVCR